MGGNGCGHGTCNGSGKCSSGSGGCSKKPVFDWLSDIALSPYDNYNIYEISFKNGARKDYFINDSELDIHVGDEVVVESVIGYDIGKISLSGELVSLQMKKRRVAESDELPKILRLANEKELEVKEEARSREKNTMLKARVMARNLGLDMKLGDVEYQADCRKATFYYTANHRVDFRELIKELAKEFKVKIEMRQIGARQEAARVGGISPSGRELCSSSWMSNLKSVNTSAARYQNLSINQSKLSGLCGRLKCCLNFELDSYLDALKNFPQKADFIETEEGKARLVKTDILQGLMFYTYPDKSTFYPITIEKVKEILALNQQGKKPENLTDFTEIHEKEEEIEFADVVGQVSLSSLDKMDKKSKRREDKKKFKNQKNTNKATEQPTPALNQANTVEVGNKSNNNRNRNRSRNKNKNNKRNNNPNSTTE